MAAGKVKWYNPAKGFGFIAPDSGGADVFVHRSELERAGIATLQENQRINYEMGSNKGKSCAVKISV